MFASLVNLDNAIMAVLSSAANGGSVSATTQKVSSLNWREETVEVETCGRSYWSFLQRARAIDNKQLSNVSAFSADDGVEEEVRLRLRCIGRPVRHPCECESRVEVTPPFTFFRSLVRRELSEWPEQVRGRARGGDKGCIARSLDNLKDHIYSGTDSVLCCEGGALFRRRLPSSTKKVSPCTWRSIQYLILLF